MKVLALDTSTLMSTCAVLDGDTLLGEYSLNQDMSHSERLIPMIKGILEELEIDISEIDLFAAAKGPGSFTGLRIGIATVKGFAHVFNKPVIGISTLEGLAQNLPYNEVIVPIIDARGNRVYRGIYTWKDGELITMKEPVTMRLDELFLELKDYENLVMNGTGVTAYKDLIEENLGSKVKFAKAGQNYCRAVSIGELALKYHKEGKSESFYTLEPEYLKVSQAEREHKKGK